MILCNSVAKCKLPKIKMHLIGKGVEEKGWDGYVDLIKRGFILPLKGIKMFRKLITDCYILADGSYQERQTWPSGWHDIAS